MKDLKCPVCGKNGIPDFHEEDVICPCCGSDLSVYHKLSNLSETSSFKIVHIKYICFIFSIAVLVLVVTLGCIFSQKISRNIKYDEQLVELQEQNSRLNDSLKYLNERLNSFHFAQQRDMRPCAIYIVRKGDSFCKISKRLYGTERRYIEIVKLNNLTTNTILHEGDSLKVSVKLWD